MPASAYASYAASTIMSSRDWSQFSPNWHAPTPTTATLSRIDSAILASGLAGERPRLPEVVRLAARIVNLAEHVFDLLLELDLCGPRVGHLHLDAAAVDLGHHHDRGRLRGGEEVVERVREQLPAPVGQAVGLPAILREALRAHARLREVDLAAARAARAEEADGGAALAEPDRRGQAEVGASLPFFRVEAPRPQEGGAARGARG